MLEIPPAVRGSITGSVDDAWQSAIEDVGPAGVDKGEGGKYLLLPHGYADPVSEGSIPMPSSTYTSAAFLRSILASDGDADIARAVAYGKQIRVYPLSEVANPARTIFIDGVDLVYDSTIPCDLRFFEALDRFVQREPWLDRGRVMIDHLKAIGIEQDTPFVPNQATRNILHAAAQEAHTWLALTYEDLFSPPFYEDAHWALPVPHDLVEGLSTQFGDPAK